VFAKRRERIAEIVLRPRPFEWNPLARELLQRQAMGLNCLLEPRWSALALAERAKRETEIVLSRRPIERNAFSNCRLSCVPRAFRQRVIKCPSMASATIQILCLLRRCGLAEG
jgi:hypothetical protein